MRHFPCGPSTRELPWTISQKPFAKQSASLQARSDLQAAIDELLSSGFHRAELSLLAGEERGE